MGERERQIEGEIEGGERERIWGGGGGGERK